MAVVRHRSSGATAWKQAALLAVALATASAAHPAGNTCEFRAAGTLSLAFGDLDPSLGDVPYQATLAGALTLREFGNCKRGIFTVRIGNGESFSGMRRLRHVTANDYIPYTLTVADTAQYPEPGNGNYPYTISFKGTIQGRDFANATEGSYIDTIVVDVNL